MDGVLQTQYRQHLPGLGQMGSRTNTNHPTQTAQRKGTCPGTRPSALAQCLLRRTRINLHGLNPSPSGRPSTTRPLTGEPYARKSPVRFGGRGGVQLPAPTPIHAKQVPAGPPPPGQSIASTSRAPSAKFAGRLSLLLRSHSANLPMAGDLEVWLSEG